MSKHTLISAYPSQQNATGRNKAHKHLPLMQFSGIIGMGRQTTQEECNDRYDGGFTDGRGSCQQTQSVRGDCQTSAQAKAVTWIQNQWAMAHQSNRLERLSHKAEKHSEIKKAGINQHQSNSVAISLSSLAWTPSDNRPSFCYPFILSDCHLASQDQGKIDRFMGGGGKCIIMHKYHVERHTTLDNISGNIAILRTSLVRLCNGNYCAALILDDIYFRACMNDDLISNEYRHIRHQRQATERSITTSIPRFIEMMSNMFEEDAVIEALNLIQKKGYADISITKNCIVTYAVHHATINNALEALDRKEKPKGNGIAPKPEPKTSTHSGVTIKNGHQARRETRIVELHNDRAKSLYLPATLTLQQWQRTLNDFNHKCAYCQTNEYQVLEHYIPLNFGGGTTADNCVPACKNCNGTKSDQHPSAIFSSKMFEDAIQRVQAYLETRRSEDL
jgi:hypothetical protein